jgi:hypothetical protein
MSAIIPQKTQEFFPEDLSKSTGSFRKTTSLAVNPISKFLKDELNSSPLELE